MCAWVAAPLLMGASAGSGVTPTTPGLPPALAALLAKKWSTSATLDASYGYRDNLVLSATDEERSAFARGTVDVLLMRMPLDRFDFSTSLQAERTHFFSGRTVDHEASAWFRTELGVRPIEALRLTMPITAYYNDRVLDVSDSEADRVVAKLKETGAMIAPTVRWAFHPDWWLEGQARGEKRYEDDRAYNSRVGEGTLRLNWSHWDWLKLEVSAAERWRDFVDRRQFSAAGRELAGTTLKFSEESEEFRAEFSGGAESNWKTSTRFMLRRYRDNGSGYFSYHERGVGQDFEWKPARWTVRAGATAYRVNYDVQTVGLGLNPTPRLRDEFAADVRVDRELSTQWSVFAAYKWERWRSNDRIASYVMNEGLLGLRRSWEK